ncbi:hypothetical protein GBF38_016619%2C partial, partial [Scomber scombrus]
TSVVDRVVHHCKKAAEWVHANENVFAANVELPDILTIDNTQVEEAAHLIAKLFESTMDLTDEDKELFLEPFKFSFYNIEDVDVL